MRLINITEEHRMFFEEFNEPEIPKYAILSHTWEKEEISYAEACATFASSHVSSDVSRAGIQKIKQFAAAAQRLGYDYIWVDTCNLPPTVDVTSSDCVCGSCAELSEAINSMYRWYRNSSVCCIYLFDILDKPDFRVLGVRPAYVQAQRETRWLTRGWTLQEFLAPRNRLFYTKNWEILSYDLHETLSEATGVPTEASEDFKPERWSVAQRMSWAAHRHTTRVEDKAYSLLGIFNVNMPLIYGEGDKAFKRLQEEIMKGSTDHTIFCWTVPQSSFSRWRGLLAKSPSEFASSGDIVENKRSKTQPFQLTNKGIQINFNLAPASSAPGDLMALLQCHRANVHIQCGIVLRRIHDDNFVRVVPDQITQVPFWSPTKQRAELQTLFAKPDPDGTTWESIEACPRIAGFCFSDPRGNLLLTRWDVRANHYTSKHQSLLEKRMFSFSLDPDTQAPELAIARCHLSSPTGDLELWLKYDWGKTYGEDEATYSQQRMADYYKDPSWVYSQCCEWKLQDPKTLRHAIHVSSWVELDSNSDAYIHIEFSDLFRLQVAPPPNFQG